MTRVERDSDAEITLQDTLDNGGKVWVIGDVHGHADALENLLSEIELGDQDCVIFLGDLIDRGPDSQMVVRIARTMPNAFTIMGNHEQMALDGLVENQWSPTFHWLYNGGNACLNSYRTNEKLDTDTFVSDLLWMSNLPHMIVLKDWILVHAGLHPSYALEDQKVEHCLWIRKKFFDSIDIIDAKRSVIFGHSITHRLLGFPVAQIGVSGHQLLDGRPAWLGIDTGVFDSVSGWLTAFELSSMKIIQCNDEGDAKFSSLQ